MATPWYGNTTSEAVSLAGNLPFKIVFFTIANKNSGSSTINVTIEKDSASVAIVPQNLVLSQGDMLQGSYDQIIEAGSQIQILVSGNVDYYFTLENTQPPESINLTKTLSIT